MMVFLPERRERAGPLARGTEPPHLYGAAEKRGGKEPPNPA